LVALCSARRGRTVEAYNSNSVLGSTWRASRTFRALTTWRARLGPEHPHTLTSAIRVGHGLSHLGQYAEALVYYQDVMSTSVALRGADHPDTLHAANGVAVNLRLLGSADAARALNEDTLSRRRHVLGEHHVDTLLSATNLAADLRALGDVAAAMNLHEETFRRYCDILGEDHPDTLRAAHNLAEDLRLLGRTDAARQVDQRTLAERRHLRLAAGALHEIGEPLRRPHDVLPVRGVGAHRRDRDELPELVEPGLVHGA